MTIAEPVFVGFVSKPTYDEAEVKTFNLTSEDFAVVACCDGIFERALTDSDVAQITFDVLVRKRGTPQEGQASGGLVEARFTSLSPEISRPWVS